MPRSLIRTWTQLRQAGLQGPELSPQLLAQLRVWIKALQCSRQAITRCRVQHACGMLDVPAVQAEVHSELCRLWELGRCTVLAEALPLSMPCVRVSEAGTALNALVMDLLSRPPEVSDLRAVEEQVDNLCDACVAVEQASLHSNDPS